MQERDGRPPVVLPHPRAIRVEDARNPSIDALLGVIRHRQRLGIALRLVVHAARADRVDVAPVRLGLRMHLRVAIHLARRSEQEAGALELGEAERVVRSVRADLQRLQRQAQVVDRARRAREVEHEINWLGDLEALRQVVRQERERVAAQMVDVRERAGLEVVDADHPLAAGAERLTEMRAQEARAAGDHRSRHRPDGTGGRGRQL